MVKSFFVNTPIYFFLLFALTLGLAPFSPPHLVEKIRMLFGGELSKAIDIFDLCLHSTPWLFLFTKTYFSIRRML